jgi:hypothetical protein
MLMGFVGVSLLGLALVAVLGFILNVGTETTDKKLRWIARGYQA